MAEKTNISWCDHTFNPWLGCDRISPACDLCYAAIWAKRAGHPELWQGQRRRTTPDNWRQPLKWDAAARAAGKRVRVFCASLADVFDNAVPIQWRVDLFELIGKTTNIDWLLLTKRIGNAHRMLDEVMDMLSHGLHRWEPEMWPGVWIGATIANQEEADRDLNKMRLTPAALHFISYEPALGPLELRPWLDFIGWVIAGGESGGKARPSHPDWFRSLRDQCAAASVPFHFKQWGSWEVASHENGYQGHLMPDTGKRFTWLGYDGRTANPSSNGLMDPVYAMAKAPKGKTGRMLDGQVWDQFPAAP